MMMPKKVKFRKQQRGRRRGLATRGQKVSFGDYGLQALEAGWVTARQIEGARIAMTRHIKRGGKIWIRVFPDKPGTKKPLEDRMGKGEGAPEGGGWVVAPGAGGRGGGGARGGQAGAACRRMPRHIKRGGKIWIRVSPDKPVTKKPLETRMGKGKGAPEEWVCVVKPARILYEMEGVSRDVAEEAFRLAAMKLPIKTRFVTRTQTETGE